MSSAGGTLTLADHGVTLTVPEGALDPGFTEEIFLAVMTEARDRPRLASGQTVLSPVVMAGPPGLSFRKPVVLSFAHCACAKKKGGWEVGVYHCDSFFAGESGEQETPWVKLVTLGQESLATPILASMEDHVIHVMTDFFTRLCVLATCMRLK